ncbi:MAG: CHAD domain-containing protein [Planctomycetota bacterium]|nr:CHAD domain-containing protein [Planctomycetota bacterium]
MALPEDILVRPPVEIAQRVALRFLDEARACRVRLADPADDTALHDFRVAVRRMRSTLSTWRDILAATMRRKDRRRLRDVQHATGSGRDAEVALEWLEPQVDDIPADARPGFDWLVARRQQLLGASMVTVRAAGIAAFLALDSGEAIWQLDPGAVRRTMAAGGSVML